MFAQLLASVIPEGLFIDFDDAAAAVAEHVWNLISKDAMLVEKRNQRAMAGQLRFRRMEETFVEICTRYGGERVNSLEPFSDYKPYQPIFRFDGGDVSIYLGMCSVSSPADLPAKNKTRTAAVKINPSHQLNMFDAQKPIENLYVTLTVARDPEAPGKILSVSVASIDGDYEMYLGRESIADILASESTDAPESDQQTGSQQDYGLKLKQQNKEANKD